MDTDGRVTDFAWAFGDGTTATGPTATHTYTSPGDYTVTLTAGDNDGASSTDTIDVTVQPNEPPTADLDANKTTAKIGRPIGFDASGSFDPDGTIERYEWALGDGTTATGPTLTHSYGSAGTYTVALTLTDDDGATSTETVDISVDADAAPSVTADATPTAVDPDETVSFSGSATDPDGSVTSYEWAFGDNTTATGQNPSHAYGSTGTYTATLTVTDSYGSTSSDSVTIDVSQNTPPSVSLSANRTEVALGDPVAFDATVSDSDGSVTSTEWQLADGTTATGTSTVHSYDTTGYFTVEFYATDDDGATTGKNLQVHVTDGTSTSSPSGPGTSRLAVDGTDELVSGEQLESSNGDYRLVLQSSDGNLVLRNTTTGDALWASNTAGDGGTNLTLQSDGNLVSYTDSGTSVWASGTAGSGADELVLEDDGSLVLYASGTEVWSANG
jgi:PKD repeat protein